MIRTLLLHPLLGNFFAFFIGMVFLMLTGINKEYAVWDGPAPVIIGVTLSCYWITRIHAYREAERIKNKQTIDHGERVLARIAMALLISIFVSGLQGLEIDNIAACMFYLGGLFWLIFDFILNRDRGERLFYVSKWYKTAFTDKLFHNEPRVWFASKIVIYLISLFLYVKALL